MMATIETKYSIGDVVYRAGVHQTTAHHPCPDCLGTKQWKAISPAGGEYTFGCPRCNSRFAADHKLSLSYWTYEPDVRRLTIGSVRHDSAETGGRNPTSYMCEETGVGGGLIYEESTLFATEDEALVAAQAKCANKNSTEPRIVERYNQTLEISDYQLSDARTKAAKAMASQVRLSVAKLFDELHDCESMDDFQECVEGWETVELAP